MIPLESATAILPRMPTGRTISGDFPLTIIKPPIVDVRCKAGPSAISSPIIRLLRSRNQRKNSSATSVRSNCSTGSECQQFLRERGDVVEGGNGALQNMQINSVVCVHKQTSCTLPDNIGNCHAISSSRGRLISSAKERSTSLQDEPFGAGKINGEEKLQPCRTSVIKIKDDVDNPEKQIKEKENCQQKEIKINSNDPVVDEKKEETCDSSVVENIKHDDNAAEMEIKQKEGSSCEKTNKRARKKCSKSKSPRKRRNSSKTASGGSGLFTRLANLNKQKKHQGLQLNSREETTRTNSHQSKHNCTKYLSVQKLHAAYAPKKGNKSNPNEKNTGNRILLPKVSNTNLLNIKSSSSTPSPGKQQQELENTSSFSSLSSLWKLWNSEDERVKKIFLSEAHSRMISGIPCAPPCTPSADELKKVEYIPSLSDVKSQRLVKTRLITIGNKMRAEEQKRKEKAAKEEQKRAYGATLQLKQRQRAEIYALNKVMTELENENFRKFMEEHSAETLPV